MPREFPRTRRLGEQIQRTLSELIRAELNDPRLALVTITHVDVSRDLGHAQVYFSITDPQADPEPASRALAGARGLLRHHLGQALVIRSVPELHFKHDTSIAQGQRMTALISEAVSRDARRREPDE